ncbi:NADH-quinone oxidoreductase subunit C [Alphaproteobacteria bacterium LSUCC0684]
MSKSSMGGALAKQNEALENLQLQVESVLAGRTLSARVFRGELTFEIPVDEIPGILLKLKDDSGGGFTQLSDLTAVDYPSRSKRFELVYQLLSVRLNQRLRLVASVADGEIVPSVSHIFSSAIWAEREVWDMFGIFFRGHGDLRRLLTDYGFEGHPLRKDFPLTGTVETRYDDSEKRVVYEPVSLTQEFRDFDFMSPWEGMQTAMRQDDPRPDTDQGEGKE